MITNYYIRARFVLEVILEYIIYSLINLLMYIHSSINRLFLLELENNNIIPLSYSK